MSRPEGSGNTRHGVLRLRYPSVAEAEDEVRSTNDGTLPLEPSQLISQYTLEAALERTVAVPPAYEMLSCHPWRQNRPAAKSRRMGIRLREFATGDGCGAPAGDTPVAGAGADMI